MYTLQFFSCNQFFGIVKNSHGPSIIHNNTLHFEKKYTRNSSIILLPSSHILLQRKLIHEGKNNNKNVLVIHFLVST